MPSWIIFTVGLTFGAISGAAFVQIMEAYIDTRKGKKTIQGPGEPHEGSVAAKISEGMSWSPSENVDTMDSFQWNLELFKGLANSTREEKLYLEELSRAVDKIQELKLRIEQLEEEK